MLEGAFLVGAGVVGGAATSAGAISSLITYPALLAVGIPPLAANVTHSLAVVGTGVASTVASGPELRGTGPRLARWALPSASGAAAGAALLLLTSDEVFDWVVPFLVAAAALLLLAQPRISAWRAERPVPAFLLPVGMFVVSVYNGYFGAASGIMLLAFVMLTVEARLPLANALKNVLLGLSDVVAATAFVVFGPIDWAAALTLGAGFLLGGFAGPAIARRAPARALRLVIAAAGLALAVFLLVSAARGAQPSPRP